MVNRLAFLQKRELALLNGVQEVAGSNPVAPTFKRPAGISSPGRPVAFHSTLQASSKVSRGERGCSLLGSPWPRLQRKFDLTVVPAKKAGGNVQAGVNQLNAFTNHVNAMLKRPKLTQEQAQQLQALIDAADQAIASALA